MTGDQLWVLNTPLRPHAANPAGVDTSLATAALTGSDHPSANPRHVAPLICNPRGIVCLGGDFLLLENPTRALRLSFVLIQCQGPSLWSVLSAVCVSPHPPDR